VCAGCEAASRPRGITRRGFLGLAACAAVELGAGRALAGAGGRDAGAGERPPTIRTPARTVNGAKVPIVVEMAHPMTAGHHVRSLEVVNASDPIPLKGRFHFSPGNGHAYVAFQARMHDGISEVTAEADCNRHGRSSASRTIEIPQGAGGCSGGAQAGLGRTRGEDIHPPVIRVPELVARGRIRPGEIIHAQVKMRHPSRTGLVFRDGGFVQEEEPLHLERLEVHFAGERIGWFEMTPALSDDPLITFTVLPRREGTLAVVVTNSRGRTFEATHEIRLS
jgi:desulfoferrodoxin (superoxide reductase-like protein)